MRVALLVRAHKPNKPTIDEDSKRQNSIRRSVRATCAENPPSSLFETDFGYTPLIAIAYSCTESRRGQVAIEAV